MAKFYGGALPCPARRNASGIKAKSTADYASTLFSMPLDACDVAVVLEDDVLPTRHLFVQPLLFQHVGTYSVILHHEKNPANVVSAGFSVD